MRVPNVVLAPLAALGATLGLLQGYALPIRWNVGPAGRWWEGLRRASSRLLGTVLDERAGPRPITDGEYAGALHESLDAVERRLWTAGFRRNPFARLKTRDGVPERGSWVWREGPLARRQLHLMLFERADGGVDVYAHEEPSSVHPLVAMRHVDGVTQHVAAGVERARERFDLDESEATVEPPEGAWDSTQT